MSQSNVDLMRDHFDAWQAAFERYWEDPRSMASALEDGDVHPETEEFLRYLDPDVEWTPIFSADGFSGLRACATAWDEWFDAAADCRLAVREVSELNGDQVLVVVDGTFVGKNPGIQVSGPVYAVMTLRRGLIVRIDEYLQRNQALEAVGGG